MRFATDLVPAVRFDWATGLYCRWFIEARTDEELADALRTGRRVYVVRVRALTPDGTERLVVWLRTNLRVYDLAGVVGPDTFAIVLPDIDTEHVEQLLMRLRREIRVPLIMHVARFPDDGLTFAALVRHSAAKWAAATAA